jgi:uncharacterized protein YuzE
MRQMNITFSAQDSSVLVRNSWAQETTIQMKSANEVDSQQVYAISNWRGVHAMFEYGSNQLISKTKIGQKITQIEYDQSGKVATMEEVNGDKKLELKVPNFKDHEGLQMSAMVNGKEVEIVMGGVNTLSVVGKLKQV